MVESLILASIAEVMWWPCCLLEREKKILALQYKDMYGYNPAWARPEVLEASRVGYTYLSPFG